MLKNQKPYENLLTIAEAAKIIGISRQAVHKRIKTGTLKKVVIGKSWFVNKKDI